MISLGSPAPLQPVSDHIEDLIERAAHAGMTVSLEWDGRRQLPPIVDRAAHRVVQEALTNAMKHAPGAAVRVQLTATDAKTVVTRDQPRLNLAEGTVKGHVSAILTRLDLDNRVQAAIVAHEAGLVAG